VSVVLLVEPGAHSVRDALACIPRDVRDTVVVDRRGDDVLDIGIAEPRTGVRLLRGGGAARQEARELGVDETHGDIVAVITFGRDGSTAAPAAISALVHALRDGADYATTANAERGVRARTRVALQRCACAIGLDRIAKARHPMPSGGRAFWRECVPMLGLGRSDVETDAQLDRRARAVGFRVAHVDNNAAVPATARGMHHSSRV
jgi:hypothetical protein